VVERLVILHGGALVLLLVGALCDLRTRRVPNALTLGGAALGLLVNLLLAPPDGLTWALSGWLLGLLLLIVPFTLRGIGGGDVKLLAAVGAWGGPPLVLATLIAGGLIGGVVALGIIIARSAPGRLRWRNAPRTLPYAPVLALGGLVAALGRWPL